MEIALNIMKQLGLNTAFFYQLVIVVLFFVVSKFLFLDRLRDILVERINKTSKLENNADQTFQEIDKLTAEYDEKMKQANLEQKTLYDSKKVEIDTEIENQLKTKQKEITEKYDENLQMVSSELRAKKQKVVNEAEGLANALVEKMSEQ
jgi:F0F1-type ATP synthase membrane subunit b/b'